jgi:hypothetical protein
MYLQSRHKRVVKSFFACLPAIWVPAVILEGDQLLFNMIAGSCRQVKSNRKLGLPSVATNQVKTVGLRQKFITHEVENLFAW